MIRELGLTCSIDELYFTRKEATKYLMNKLGREDVEIPYLSLQNEIFKRLLTTNYICEDNESDFNSLFEVLDARSEQSVQFLNQTILDTLKSFKSQGGKIYLVSDFYGSKSLFEKLLKYHGIDQLFDEVFSSAELEKSKYSATIYNQILSQLNIDANEVMMIGDNKRSDYTNAINNGLNAFRLPHQNHLRRNKLNNFGNDKNQLKKILSHTYKKCNSKKSTPYTEYIIFYHVFVERLYTLCRRRKIKNLFFLSREGQFLKRLFDSYQDYTNVDKSRSIRTHYLKISRQASLQIALRPIEEESFGYLKDNYNDLSLNDFLEVFSCPESLVHQIVKEIQENGERVIPGFFYSKELNALMQNDTFVSFYNAHKEKSRDAFEEYINSFDAQIEINGMHVVDIGWGGTMQESIYKFFQGEIAVTGYYLGLGEIYDIQPKTKRYGLIFSLLPYPGYTDNILMANKQLYEQFSAANHGSALGYSKETEGFVLEYHKPEEKWLYDNHIKSHQEEMFNLHRQLLKDLDIICYGQLMMQQTISNLALKIGLFQSSKKIKFLKTLSEGFYQNIGTNQVGLTYEKPKIKSPLKSSIRFLMTPENYFRYLVKLKAALNDKNRIMAILFPFYLIYFHYRINAFLRFKVFHRSFLLKYNFFK